jgi:hypothetical protein
LVGSSRAGWARSRSRLARGWPVGCHLGAGRGADLQRGARVTHGCAVGSGVWSRQGQGEQDVWARPWRAPGARDTRRRGQCAQGSSASGAGQGAGPRRGSSRARDLAGRRGGVVGVRAGWLGRMADVQGPRCRAESRGGSAGSPGARWVERSEGEKERVGERENRGRERE